MEQLFAKMKEYEAFFKTSFPSFCFMHLSPEEMIKMMDECLEKEKDVYQLGFLSEEEEGLDY